MGMDWKQLLLRIAPTVYYIVPLVDAFGAPTREETLARFAEATDEQRAAIRQARRRLMRDGYCEWKKVDVAAARLSKQDPEAADRLLSFILAVLPVRGGAARSSSED